MPDKNNDQLLAVQAFLASELKDTKNTVKKSYFMLVLLIVVIAAYTMLYIYLVSAPSTLITWLAIFGLLAVAGWQVYTLESSRRYASKIVNWYLATQAVYYEKLNKETKNKDENELSQHMPKKSKKQNPAA